MADPSWLLVEDYESADPPAWPLPVNFSNSFGAISPPVTPQLPGHGFFDSVSPAPLFAPTPTSASPLLRRKPSSVDLAGGSSNHTPRRRHTPDSESSSPSAVVLPAEQEGERGTSACVVDSYVTRNLTALAAPPAPNLPPSLLQAFHSPSPLQNTFTSSPSLSSTISTLQSSPAQTPQPPGLGGQGHHGDPPRRHVSTKRKFHTLRQAKRLPRAADGHWLVYAAVVDTGPGIRPLRQRESESDSLADDIDDDNGDRTVTSRNKRGTKTRGTRSVRFAGLQQTSSGSADPSSGDDKGSSKESTYTLSKYKFPPPPSHTWADTFGHLNEPTPPTSPATLHYRGASFDLVNPHASLLLGKHDIETPGEIEGLLDEYFDRSGVSHDTIVGEMSEQPNTVQDASRRGRRYADPATARREIMRNIATAGALDPYALSHAAEINHAETGLAREDSSPFKSRRTSTFSDPFDTDEEFRQFEARRLAAQQAQAEAEYQAAYDEDADAEADAHLYDRNTTIGDIVDHYDYRAAPPALCVPRHRGDSVQSIQAGPSSAVLAHVTGCNAYGVEEDRDELIDLDLANVPGPHTMTVPRVSPPPQHAESVELAQSDQTYGHTDTLLRLTPAQASRTASMRTHARDADSSSNDGSDQMPPPGLTARFAAVAHRPPASRTTDSTRNTSKLVSSTPSFWRDPDMANANAVRTSSHQSSLLPGHVDVFQKQQGHAVQHEEQDDEAWEDEDTPNSEQDFLGDAHTDYRFSYADTSDAGSLADRRQSSQAHPSNWNVFVRQPSSQSSAFARDLCQRRKDDYNRLQEPAEADPSTPTHPNPASSSPSSVYDHGQLTTYARARAIIERCVMQEDIAQLAFDSGNVMDMVKAVPDTVELRELRKLDRAAVQNAVEDVANDRMGRVASNASATTPLGTKKGKGKHREHDLGHSFKKAVGSHTPSQLRGAASFTSSTRALINDERSRSRTPASSRYPEECDSVLSHNRPHDLAYSDTFGTFHTVSDATNGSPGSPYDVTNPLIPPMPPLPARLNTARNPSTPVNNDEEGFEMSALSHSGIRARPAMSSQTRMRPLLLANTANPTDDPDIITPITSTPRRGRRLTDAELIEAAPHWGHVRSPYSTPRRSNLADMDPVNRPALRDIESLRPAADRALQRRISNFWFGVTIWCPITAWLYGFGVLDGLMRRATDGRLTEMATEDMWTARWVAAPLGTIVYTLVGVIVGVLLGVK